MLSLEKLLTISAILLLLLFSGCGTNNDDDNVKYYEFTHESEDINYSIVAKTSNPDVIAKVEDELSKPFEERTMHINGPIERGNAGYNRNWSWHFVEDRWDLAEISVEVCDGRPSFVEEDLDYWVDTVGRYCPWGSRVAGEVNP